MAVVVQRQPRAASVGRTGVHRRDGGLRHPDATGNDLACRRFHHRHATARPDVCRRDQCCAHSIQAETIKLVPDGTQLLVTGDSKEAEGAVWWPVRDPSDNKEGWAVSTYLIP
jgi:hypothetical protein